MGAAIWKTGTSNAFSTTLNGSIASNTTSIVLTTTTGLQAPGVLVIDRVDANNVASPTVREYISYTGIATNTLTGCSRGLGGSSAQAHSSGATVEEAWSITHWNDFITAYQVSHDTSGNIVATSFATLTDVRVTNSLNVSGASIMMTDLKLTNSLNISGASLTGNFPITPVWVMTGTVSAATSTLGKPLSMPQGGIWSWVSFLARTPASGASMVFDIKKNNSSIFTASILPAIAGGGTYVSTASINTKSYSAGDVFTVDLNNAGNGSITDVTAEMRGY